MATGASERPSVVVSLIKSVVSCFGSGKVGGDPKGKDCEGCDDEKCPKGKLTIITAGVFLIAAAAAYMYVYPIHSPQELVS